MTTNKKAKLPPLSDRNNIMLRPERELGDVVDGAILVDHQDVVLAVASSTWHIPMLYFSLFGCLNMDDSLVVEMKMIV